MSTPQTNAPEWDAAQETPWVQANKARRVFDAFSLRTSVLDRDLAAPPGTCPANGRYLIAASATGAWAGHDGELAIAFGENASNGWVFATVEQEGVQIWVEDEETQIEYAGGGWVVSPERIFELDQLADVDLTGLNDGDQLFWDSSNQQWYPGPPESVAASAIAALTDVDLTGLADGDVLKWDASNQLWVPQVDEVGEGGGGGGATTLDGLTDVDTTGLQDGYALRYDASNGLWYAVPEEQQAVPVRSLVGAANTLEPAHANTVNQITHGSATTVTIGPETDGNEHPDGSYLEVIQFGAGTVTIAAGSGVTVVSRGSLVDTAGQYAVVGLRRLARNSWVLTGDLA